MTFARSLICRPPACVTLRTVIGVAGLLVLTSFASTGCRATAPVAASSTASGVPATPLDTVDTGLEAEFLLDESQDEAYTEMTLNSYTLSFAARQACVDRLLVALKEADNVVYSRQVVADFDYLEATARASGDYSRASYITYTKAKYLLFCMLEGVKYEDRWIASQPENDFSSLDVVELQAVLAILEGIIFDRRLQGRKPYGFDLEVIMWTAIVCNLMNQHPNLPDDLRQHAAAAWYGYICGLGMKIEDADKNHWQSDFIGFHSSLSFFSVYPRARPEMFAKSFSPYRIRMLARVENEPYRFPQKR